MGPGPRDEGARIRTEGIVCMQRLSAMPSRPSAQKYGPPATIPAPAMLLEYATWS